MPDGFLKYTTKAFPNSLSSNPSSVVVLVRSLALFVKLRKATISFVVCLRPHVCLLVRMEKLGSHGTDFREVWCWVFFEKSVENIQIALKSAEESHVIHMQTYVHFVT